MDTDQRDIYDRIMLRYGRPGFRGSGGAMRCRPSNAELRGEEQRRAPEYNDGRVIFDRESDARDAIAALVDEGAPPQEPYPCPRSRSGHWHIRRALQPATTSTDQDGDPPT